MTNSKLVTSLVTIVVALWCTATFAEDYFPASLDMPLRLKNSKLLYYSEVLESIDEAPLWPLAKDLKSSAYRFVYIRTRIPQEPVVLRLERTATLDWILTVKVADYSSEESTLREHGEKRLTQEEVKHFESLFGQLEFWSLPTVGALEAEEVLFDGTECVMEAVDRGHYNLVTRRSPKYTGNIWNSLPDYAEGFEKQRIEEGYPRIDRETSERVNKQLVSVAEFMVKLSGLQIVIE